MANIALYFQDRYSRPLHHTQKKKDNAYCKVIQLVRRTGLALSSKAQYIQSTQQAPCGALPAMVAAHVTT